METIKLWRYFGRTSGSANIYEIYRIPDNGIPFINQDPSKHPERLRRDGSWKYDSKDNAIWNELMTGDFNQVADEISEEEVKRLFDLWTKTKWLGRE
jgi:hypothetical protein